MTDTASTALKTLRETLRGTIGDVETLVECLRACLRDVGVGGTSGSVDLEPDQVKRAIQRYLPSIQIQLLSDIYPTFHHALSEPHLRILEEFFVPSSTSHKQDVRLSSLIGLTSYLTLPPFLNAAHTPPLPAPTRSFLVDILRRLGARYSIDEMYWAIWSHSSKDKGKGKARTGPEDLMWEEVVKSLAGVPAKSANALGRWNSEGWVGELPVELEPRLVYPTWMIVVALTGQSVL